MIPGFEIAGGVTLALARAASVAGLSVAAGGLVYARAIRPIGLDVVSAARLRRLCAWSLAAALGGALLWLAAETRDLAGGLGPGDVGAVLGTLFGRLLAGRVVLLALAAAAFSARYTALAAALACGALALQAGHSHALAMRDSPVLLASSTVHILAAGLWLGGLPGLFAVIAWGPEAQARAAAERFSRLGMACVAALLVTAAFQAWVLVASVAGLVGTAYGRVVLVKAELFVGLIMLAVCNRWRRMPGLPATRGALAWSILLEIGLGFGVLAAAGVLTGLQPAMHSQAGWPFVWMPSLSAVREDPDVAREVLLAGGAMVLGVGLLALAIWLGMRRRTRAAVLAAAAACLIGGSAAPHFSPLLVQAVPTQFYHSTTGFSAASIVSGGALYGELCVTCHGAGGRGDGKLAHSLAVPPADLTAAHLWMHSDGELFWWLTHGIEGPRGGLAMPGFSTLSDDGVWALIDFLHARNAGLTLSTMGWARPVMAPDFAITCAGIARKLSELRGHVVALTLGLHVTVSGQAGERCTADEDWVDTAYAIAAPGAGSVLVDANGWLRAANPGPVAPDPRLAATPLPHNAAAQGMAPDMKM